MYTGTYSLEFLFSDVSQNLSTLRRWLCPVLGDFCNTSPYHNWFLSKHVLGDILILRGNLNTQGGLCNGAKTGFSILSTL